jgi:hypothetical protein
VEVEPAEADKHWSRNNDDEEFSQR